jgi:hypothetical protein
MKHPIPLVIAPLALLALLVSAAASAQEAPKETPKKPSDTASEISAQTDITARAIDAVLRKVEDRKVDPSYQAKDYWAWSDAFRPRVEEVMKAFQTYVEGTTLKRLSYWMERYNEIVTSPDYTAEQKKPLLQAQYQQIQGKIQQIEAEYHAEIRKLYAVVGDIPYGFDVAAVPDQQYVGKGGNSWLKKFANGFVEVDFKHGEWAVSKACLDHYEKLGKDTRKYSSGRITQFELGVKGYVGVTPYRFCTRDSGFLRDLREKHTKWVPDPSRPGTNVQYTDESAVFAELRSTYSLPDLFHARVYPILKEGCASEVCVGQKANDFSHLITLINVTLDRDLVVTLADGQAKLTVRRAGVPIDFANRLLSRTDYPEKLPFDSR